MSNPLSTEQIERIRNGESLEFGTIDDTGIATVEFRRFGRSREEFVIWFNGVILFASPNLSSLQRRFARLDERWHLLEEVEVN